MLSLHRRAAGALAVLQNSGSPSRNDSVSGSIMHPDQSQEPCRPSIFLQLMSFQAQGNHLMSLCLLTCKIGFLISALFTLPSYSSITRTLRAWLILV